MGLSQQKFREIVFQFLYGFGFDQNEKGELSLIMRQNAIPKSSARLALEKAEKIWDHYQEIDQKIKYYSDAYEFERIPMVERTILRLGIFELFYSDLPYKIAIAEAIRLTKKFATAEGANFVNAILDRLYQEKEDALSPREEQIS